eukprot:g23229.t1
MPFLIGVGLQLAWQSQNLISATATQRLNATKALNGMISNDEYVEALLDANASVFGDERWIIEAWLICDKNQAGNPRDHRARHQVAGSFC